MGPDPSVGELLDTMHCMHIMIARQAHVEQSIMDQLTYDTSEDEMGQILRFFHGTGTCCKRFWVLCTVYSHTRLV